MKTQPAAKTVAIAAAIIGIAVGIVVTHYMTATAGDLNPTAAPGPTMKTLDEVEARIPIPGSATQTSQYTIDESGSYYLTGDRYCSGSGIIINASNVTLDLNGYSLIGSGLGTYYGIRIYSDENLEVKNGTVRNFGSTGVSDATSGDVDYRFLDLKVINNGGYGVYGVSDDIVVEDCTVAHNQNHGIYLLYRGIVRRCIVHNSTSSGIYVGQGSIVEDCLSRDNGLYGIDASSGCIIRNNSVYSNDLSGIDAAQCCVITGNTAYDNENYGIQTGSGCTIIGNTAYSSNQYGIYGGAGCVLKDNAAYMNADGLRAVGGCTVIGNSAYSNTGYGIRSNSESLVDQNACNSNGTNLSASGCTLGVNEY